MRDLNRIDPFLARIGKVWKENCPDWRFGQLIVNACDRDPFYMEEDEFAGMVEKFFGGSKDGK